MYTLQTQIQQWIPFLWCQNTVLKLQWLTKAHDWLHCTFWMYSDPLLHLSDRTYLFSSVNALAEILQVLYLVSATSKYSPKRKKNHLSYNRISNNYFRKYMTETFFFEFLQTWKVNCVIVYNVFISLLSIFETK